MVTRQMEQRAREEHEAELAREAELAALALTAVGSSLTLVLPGLFNPFKLEFIIVIYIHYKPRIAVEFLIKIT